MKLTPKLTGLIALSLLLPTIGLATTQIFPDVSPTEWFAPAVSSVQEKGLMQGFPDQTFRPDLPVNRAQLAAVLDKTLGYLNHPQGAEAWKRHLNRTFAFQVGYPSQWRAIRFFDYLSGFQPPSMEGNNVQWAVIVLDDEPTTLEEQIDKMGADLKSKTVMRERLIINDHDALKVTVRTLDNPNWEHVQLFFQAYGKLYIVTNGAIPDKDFDLFYQSFEILPLTAQQELEILNQEAQTSTEEVLPPAESSPSTAE
ncbi:hypothetical protein CO046_03510 [Candidatus Peregrinibacteria bacterium CG_4_9_14_0_2_um_filter_53_11]|nr:MAG: hypothetical protein CO046_03510 [Candidatus Peregrinibacteria bacterium CG_4_9_14_0_2_um_filter_53_11]